MQGLGTARLRTVVYRLNATFSSGYHRAMSKHHLVENRTCHRSTGSWRLELVVSVVAIALACAVACNKAPAEKPQTSQSQQPAEPGITPVVNPVDANKAELDKLAHAYHTVRCILVGAKAGSDTFYGDLGYGDADGFNKAFEDAAKRDPAWAKATLAASYARPCRPSQP